MLIPTSKNTRNITDFRKDPDSILEAVQGKSDPLYLFRGSEPKAVVLSLEQYIHYREMVEDYYDMMLIRDIEDNPEKGRIESGDFLKELDIDLPRKNVSRHRPAKSAKGK